MPTRRTNPRKWLGIMMIALGIIVFVAFLSASRPGYYRQGLYGYPHHQYGHHMMGSGPMWGAWRGRYQMPYFGGMMPDMSMLPGLDAIRGFDLSEDQQERVGALEEQIREKRWSLFESLRAESQKLNALLLGDRIDPGALSEQYARCAQLRRQIFELGLEERQKIDEVLTDEQRAELRRWQREYMARWRVD